MLMRRITLVLLVLCVQYAALWGKKNYEYRYWFDGNESTAQTGEFEGAEYHIDADISDMESTLHFIHLQVRDTANVWSAPITRYFLKMPQIEKATIYYWMDSDFNSLKSMEISSGAQMLDVTGLEDGFHVLNVMADDKYSTSAPVIRRFIKVPQVVGVDYLNCLCIIDDELYKNEQVPSSGGIVNWEFDVSQFTQGVHAMKVLVVTPSGAATSASNQFFVRATLAEEINNMKLVYNVDGNVFETVDGSAVDGLYHFDLDVSSLEDGLHRITYQLASASGTSTKFSTQFFVKTPLGGTGITRYDYWLNDDRANAVVTDIDPRVDELSVVKLLEVNRMPLRSSCFQFEVTDGVPTMYAKNDFHILFYDASGRGADETKQYVDYNVKQAIAEVADLQTTQTFARPAANEVKWFKFDAEYGDSIAIKSNVATMLDIFASDGAKLYSAEGNESVKLGGCHLKKDATYYVAVHDVKGSASNITLECQRIDKFAVFECNPVKLPKYGKTIMYFKGNGLEYVESVKLTNGSLTLTADTVISSKNYGMLARFDITETQALTGKYSVEVFFNNRDEGDSDTVILNNVADIEDLKKGTVKVDVTSERRVTDPYEIKVTLTNTGNVPLYSVPLDIAFDNVNVFDEFLFLNFDILMSHDLAKSKDFFTYTDNLLGKGVKGFFMPMMIPYLGPYEEKTLVFGVRSKIPHAKFNFYAWAGEAWYYEMPESASDATLLPPEFAECVPSNIPQAYDCMDLGDDLSELAGLPISPGKVLRPFIGAGEAIGGIVQGATRARDDAVLRAYGLDPNDPANDQYRMNYRHCSRSPRDIARDAMPFQNMAEAPVETAGIEAYSCSLDGYATSPCPDPDRYQVDIYIPGDPNEITGYLSAAESKFMPDSIPTVSYDIEFENDPEIANSAAHKIVIENVLDGSKFDLQSFRPNDITLSGNKVVLDGEQSFVKTIDLRPAIDAIAELQCEYDAQSGRAVWTFTSLDPMTMEPTDDYMQGILPVNYDGESGIGNITYTIDLAGTFADGTEISNKASIIFDNNDAIVTPVWTNTIDAVAPQSEVTDVVQKNDSIVTIHLDGADNRSGIWKYEVYAQLGEGATWQKVAECDADTACVDYRYYDGIVYGFCAVATDMAGNVETKEFTKEGTFVEVNLGDVNSDGEVNTLDASLTLGYYLEQQVPILAIAADVNEDGAVNTLDATQIIQMYLNYSTSEEISLMSLRQRVKRREIIEQ